MAAFVLSARAMLVDAQGRKLQSTLESTGPVSPTLRMGEVATRIGVPGGSLYGGPGLMCQSWHELRSDVTALRIGLAAWGASSGEFPTASAVTMRCSVRSAGGAFTQGAIAGNPAPSVTPGATASFDVPFAGSAGDKFYIRHQYLGASIPYGIPTRTRPLDTARGDAVEFSTTDKTLSGTVIDAGANVTVYPVSCKALTTNGWIDIIGTSRAVGSSDSLAGPDATGLCGNIERPFGARYGFANLACAGEQAAGFIQPDKGVRRAALIDPGAIVICEMGINDLFGGGTDAILAARIATLRAMLPADIEFWLTTMGPVVTTSDDLTTLVGQTPDAGTAQRLLANARRLANAAGYAGCIDLASQQADASDSQRWRVNAGVPFQYAYDDRPTSPIVIHETKFGNQQLTFAHP